MRNWTPLLMLALMVLPAASPVVQTEEPVPIAPGVDIPLEAQQFLYPPDSAGAPEGTVWGTADGKEMPLAPGVDIPLAQPLPLQQCPETALSIPESEIQSLSVPAFSQNDAAWKNDVMQTCGETAGRTGAALTSAAMVFEYYGATSGKPGRLNTCLKASACPVDWSLAANTCGESKASWVGSWAFAYSKLESMLAAGRPPIVELTKGTSTHFVVVTGGSGTAPANYTMNDPWDGTITKHLSDYTANGWTLYAIEEFSKR